MELLQFPKSNIPDVSASLRELADGIDAGDYGDAHNLAWIIDEGDGSVSFGMMGTSTSPGAEAHLLFCIAAKQIEEM